MAHADATPPLSTADLGLKTSTPPRGLALLAMAILIGFVVTQGRTLWKEWGDLQRDMSHVRRTAVIGYPNIHPNPSYARKPSDWFHHEGEFTLLWSGWKGQSHQWFRVARGEVEQERISLPMGRDVIQAIDYPIVENDGGQIWKKIPGEAEVVGFEVDGVLAVYPLHVLNKVAVVNDLIGERPRLVTFNPARPQGSPVHVFEPIVEGHRITLGMSGYFHDRKPMLYDRGTESLWVQRDDGTLESIAGRYRGSSLRSIGKLAPVSWGDWRWQHPKSRLLIGADRSKDLPST